MSTIESYTCIITRVIVFGVNLIIILFIDIIT